MIEGVAVDGGTDDGSTVAPRRRHLAVGIAVVLAVAGALLVVVLATREPATDRAVNSPLLGKLAPAIQATTLDGDDFDLDRLQGRWVLVNFFATWCVPCQVEHPELASFYRRHQQAGDATVVSVVFGDDQAAVEQFFAREGGGWPVVVGDQGRIALDYGVLKVPESYLLDPSGRVAAKLVGGVTSTGLDQLIDELMAEASAQ